MIIIKHIHIDLLIMNNKIAVIMCTWKRLNRLTITLDLLLKQNNKDFTFYIWNNNKEIQNQVNIICESYRSFLDIKINHSESNIGGIGRFEYAKIVSDIHDIVIFIDDDQEFNENMVSIFKNEYSEKKLKSRWAWRFNGDNYTNRTKISDGGCPVHYCGTGGLVVSSKIFKLDIVFQIPEEFKFIEDLWLSYVCDSILGFDLESIEDSGFIYQTVDGLDQFNSLIPMKNKFMNYLLTERKWMLK